MPAPPRAWRSLALPWKVFLGGAAVLGLVLGLMFAMLSRWAQRSGEAVVQRELEQSADIAGQYLSARQRSLAGGGGRLAEWVDWRRRPDRSRDEI